MRDSVQKMKMYKNVYMKKTQFTECNGRCEKYEVDGYETDKYDVILVVGCTYCHVDDFTTCRAQTQQGERCRAQTWLGKNGLCHRHSNWDMYGDPDEFGSRIIEWKKVRIHHE